MQHDIQEWQTETDCLHLKACRRMQKICLKKLHARIPRYCNAVECSCYEKSSRQRLEQLKAQRTNDYIQYLRSQKFQELKMRVLTRDGFQCKLCGTAKNLCVHHITYERRGHEDLSDLITLCTTCHNKIHANDLTQNKDTN